MSCCTTFGDELVIRQMSSSPGWPEYTSAAAPTGVTEPAWWYKPATLGNPSRIYVNLEQKGAAGNWDWHQFGRGLSP